MLEHRWIPRNEAGTRATLAIMKSVVLASNQELRALNWMPAEEIDSYLRRFWQYVPDGENELIRTPERMVNDRMTSGRYQGDCDDAAVMAGAILLAKRRNKPETFLAAELMAVRPPSETSFVHVFTNAWHLPLGRRFRIDPTAPTNADYSNWETMVEPLF